MLATLTMLAFAHVLADFVLQSRAMVARKHRRAVLLRHTAIVGTTAFVALAAWTPGALIAVAVVTLAHAGIDAAKQCRDEMSKPLIQYDMQAELPDASETNNPDLAGLFPGA